MSETVYTQNTHADYLVLSTVRDAIYDIANSYVLTDFLQSTIVEQQNKILEIERCKDFDECTPVGKTYLGQLLENCLRRELRMVSGIRDLNIRDCLTYEQQDLLASAAYHLNIPHPFEVDVKNSMKNSWLIPPESYGENGILLLIGWSRYAANSSMGLALAKPEYLSEKSNRDQKKRFTANGQKNILWIAGKKAQ